jgi:hypothetical protein
MWIFTTTGVLSIVEDWDDPDRLLVRARYEGDIERHFGEEAEVIEMESSDYRFRAFLPREEVQAVIDRELSSLDYGNFKNSFDRDNVSLSRKPGRRDTMPCSRSGASCWIRRKLCN